MRDVLRLDHEAVLSELEALRSAAEGREAQSRLRLLRRRWVIHALAEETVVYNALEGLQGAASTRADERFVEHELVEGLFDKLSRGRPGTLEWDARLNVARSLILRHIEAEHEDLFARLATRFDTARLVELGQRFQLAREKLNLLEEAKAA
ncbi:MAG TPA: hemerythrin domain-containing protein [Usitatibacter sp.]|nr:hemerythrin domain-containing protein [Usitatibacter sp.]